MFNPQSKNIDTGDAVSLGKGSGTKTRWLARGSCAASARLGGLHTRAFHQYRRTQGQASRVTGEFASRPPRKGASCGSCGCALRRGCGAAAGSFGLSYFRAYHGTARLPWKR